MRGAAILIRNPEGLQDTPYTALTMELKRYQFGVSVAALLISLGSATVSAYLTTVSMDIARQSMRLGIRPALVVLDEPGGWTIRNVGNGPAFNVIVICMPHDHGDDAGDWSKPISIQPLERNGSAILNWIGANPDKIGVYYRDANDRPHTSVTNNDLTRFGEDLPKLNQEDVTAWWKVTSEYCQ